MVFLVCHGKMLFHGFFDENSSPAVNTMDNELNDLDTCEMYKYTFMLL